jgi:hypothetical protein
MRQPVCAVAAGLGPWPLPTASLDSRACSGLSTTVSSNKDKLSLAAEAARAEGRPKARPRRFNQSREAHLAAWPLHPLEGG